MRLALNKNLLFTEICAGYEGKSLVIQDILIDTGSATTILAIDATAPLGISPQAEDILRIIRGVGGIETVFTRTLSFLQLGEIHILNFAVEIGGMDYGFPINGIIGMDFLLKSGAVIDLQSLSISFPSANLSSP